MKGKKLKNVLIVAILAALLCVCTVLCLLPDKYTVSAEEVSTESVIDDNGVSDSEENPEFDLNDFLAWVQKYADEAGIGNEYAKAVEAIKTAASQKQVTISTVASVAQLGVFVVYLIYTNVKNGKLKRQLKEVSEKLDLQIRGTNGLIDESNANGATGQSTKKEVEQLSKQVVSVEKSLTYLLTGFSILIDRFNIGAESKEAVKHEFNCGIRAIDGEGGKNENKTE